MQESKVILANNQTVKVEAGGGVKEVEAFHKGEKIKIVKRTTTIKITDEAEAVIAEMTVSCSHKDGFDRVAGRREAWKHLVESPLGKEGVLSDHENRRRIVEALRLKPKPKLTKEAKLLKKEEHRQQKQAAK